jgi:hypothetical protein
MPDLVCPKASWRSDNESELVAAIMKLVGDQSLIQLEFGC